MSVGGNGGGMVSDAYNDYEAQFLDISAKVNFDDNAVVAGDEAIGYEITVDPLEGLDREELAEIVALDFRYQFAPRDGEANSELSSVISDIACRINSPTLTSAGISTEKVQDSGSDEELENVSAEGHVNEGVLFSGNTTATTAYRNSTDGSGGGSAQHSPVRFQKDFRDLLDGGPVVDRFDDIGFFVNVQSKNYVGVAKLELKGHFYYATEQRDTMGSQF
jgi:hypothetical protein